MSTREEIIIKSIELFSAQGYENIGTQKIVDTAGITKPTLYHHFKSKQGLLEEIVKGLLDPLLEELEEVAKYNKYIEGNIEGIIKTIFNYGTQRVKEYRFILSLFYSSIESQGQRVVQPYLSRKIEMLKNVFLEAEQDHGNMKGRSYEYALSLLGTINSYLLGYYYGFNTIDITTVEKVKRQFCYGIFS